MYSSYTARLEYSISLFPVVAPCYPLLLLYYLVGVSEGYVYEVYVYCSNMHYRRGLGACVKNCYPDITVSYTHLTLPTILLV